MSHQVEAGAPSRDREPAAETRAGERVGTAVEAASADRVVPPADAATAPPRRPLMVGEPGTKGRGQFESAFAIATSATATAVREARQIAHDTVVTNSGRSRRSGVTWTHYPAATALDALGDYGIDDMPEVARLCALFPAGVLVMATVEVDESVKP